MTEWVINPRASANLSDTERSTGMGFMPDNSTYAPTYIKLVPYDLYVTIESLGEMFVSTKRHFTAKSLGKKRIGNLRGSRGDSEVHGQGPPFPEIYKLVEADTDPIRTIPEVENPAIERLREVARITAAENQARIQASRLAQQAQQDNISDERQLAPAIITGDLRVIRSLITDENINKRGLISPNQDPREQLFNPLELAVFHWSYFSVKLLLELGADVNVLNEDGKSLLWDASAIGPDDSDDIERKKLMIFELLVSSGIDTTVIDDSNESIIQFLVGVGNDQDYLEILENHRSQI
jgi:hypothetical protein